MSVDQAWHFRADNRDAYPTYAPLLPADVRRLVESSQTLRDRLLERGLPVWGDPKSAASLLPLLAKLLLNGGVDEAQLASFRKTYERALGDVATTQFDPFHDAKPLLVMRSGRIIGVTNGTEPNTVPQTFYVKDGPIGLAGYLLEDLGVPIVSAPDGSADLVVSLLRRSFGKRVKRASDLHVEVLVDHAPFTPGAADPLLSDEVPWIEAFIALTMEFRSSRSDHRTEAVQRRTLERLARVRLRRAEHIRITVDGQEADLPPFLQGAVPVRNEVYPTIVLPVLDSPLQWADLRALAPALAEVLEQPWLQDSLSLCILELERRLGAPVRNPTEQDYAEVFRTRPDQVRQLLALAKGPARTILDKLYPLVAHLAGLVDAEHFNPTGAGADLGSPEAVEAALAAIAHRLPYPASELLSACANAESLAGARNALGLDYAGFNRTLSRLGAPYAPIHNVEGHRQAFDFFLQSHWGAIQASIRTLALPDFERGDSLVRYVELRKLPGLEPDTSWLDECDVPPDALIHRHVNEWLHQVGAPELGKGDSALMPLDKVVEQNTRTVQAFTKEAQKVVRAWCRKQQTPPPPVWRQEGSAPRLEAMAGAEGIMDFRPLIEPDLIAWLSRTSRWPGGMKPTISPEDLELSEQDLRAEEEAAGHERRRREQERRSIKLDGVLMSADRADFRAIIDHVSKTLAPNLLATPARFAGLEPISGTGSGTKGGTGGRGGGSGGSRTRPNDVQTAAIGLIGELVAYRWLQATYKVGDECWKSTYRHAVLGGNEGNDSLGYDFVVMRTRGELYFEVKATSGDALELELGETEIALASKLARTDRRTDRYRILFIRHALDSSQRSIHMLPNPLSEHGRSFYRTVGRGLRYEFSLAR